MINNQSKPDRTPGGAPESPLGLTAREAAERLGVKLPTLYAYVSRGLLRSVPGEGGRARRYLREDVEALRNRSRRAGARAALRWGDPVLETQISAMTAEGPVYRGHPAGSLAEADTPFEAVAELLWTGTLPAEPPRWPVLDPDAVDLASVARLVPPGAPSAVWNPVLVGALAARDPGRFDTARGAVLARARQLVRLLTVGLALPHDPGRAEAVRSAPTIADAAILALGGSSHAAAVRAVDRTLVLLAEHELNASTFAARVTASTRADVYACVQSGLATLAGPLHGAVSEQVEALVAEAGRPERVETVIHERQRRGERIPGFGHGFYPEGDPRARPIFEAAWGLRRRSRVLRVVDALVSAMELARRPAPNVDAALVALRGALGRPRGAGAGLFAVARCAGWVAHALEQYETGHLLRPRARYRAGEHSDEPPKLGRQGAS